ncbi:hypothetical protein [Oceanicoccus sp. KOV_DT_Chl]|uniref:hypothetical protein n=1 Tax=Oceanicoccus sp. KOV_DT_Chl TaxID=1904639 RepID=UPI00135B0D83|nr:hypothetical protein [Oceanicoccus sp. KOV_DT_Chl]
MLNRHRVSFYMAYGIKCGFITTAVATIVDQNTAVAERIYPNTAATRQRIKLL